MIRSILIVFGILLIIILIAYLGASFIFFDWNWISTVDEEIRLAFAFIVLLMWGISIYGTVKLLNEDD